MGDSRANTWIEPLAAREVQILDLVSGGLSNREVAQKLSISLDTIKWYNKQIYRKLGVSNRAQAVKIAAEHGLLEPESVMEQGDQDARLGNLPAQLTSFVGREKEIAQIRDLLRSNRLVVLTGAGGSGKTRLALQLATEIADYYPDGAWLVELASLRDSDLVPQTIAQVLEISMGASKSPIETLVRFLARKHLLLLLDNFEHLLEAAPLVGELLSAAPQLSVLATSRERLHIYGEQEYPVRPLQLPEPQHPEPLEKLLSYEAIKLFTQRARSARPGFELSEKTLPAILRICTHLDGLPLALELAASQVKIYSPQVLAQQLEKNLDVLLDGPRDLPARQRTLRATIEWSEKLLEPEERTLFARLAVFSGGASLEAIEQVCRAGLNKNLIELLSALVDKNLVLARESQEGEIRFTMLETIHDYAHERLLSSEKIQEIQQLHADYYTDLAGQASREFFNSRQADWFTKLHHEQDNLRSVLAWSIEGSDFQYALRLVDNLRDYWYLIDNFTEGVHWCDRILEKEPDGPPELLAGMLMTAGFLAGLLGRGHTPEKLLRSSLELYRQSGDERGTALAMSYLGSNIGLKTPDETRHGIELLKQSLEIFRKLGDQAGMTLATITLGELSRGIGDYEAAQHYYEETLSITRQTGDRLDENLIYLNLSYCAYQRKQYRIAVELVQKALVTFKELSAGLGQIGSLAVLAGPINELGDHEKAARLLGAAEAACESLGFKYQPADQMEIDRYEISTRQAMREEAFRAAWQVGYEMSLEQAIEYALS
jgi:predicted ATPase/DNA-binding CsgD family transcriptional regulator